jgi:aspartate/methionine/tyrosine aminotransferase
MSIRDLLALEPGAAEAFDCLWLGYTQSQGDPELRRTIASLFETIDEEQVLVHSGGQEAIFVFMNVALSAGDHVIAQFPAYQSHYSVAESIGAEISRWDGDLDAEGAPDPDELERLVRPSTRAIIITTPNNPTGYVFDRRRLDRVVEIARRHGLLLFSDEIYRGSERDARDRHPAACDLYERAVSLGGTAKVYGLAGLRIGWIATRDAQTYAQMARFKDYLTICNSAPSEFLTTLALRHEGALRERVRAIAVRNLDLLDTYFARNADLWRWRRPRAGTTAFPRYLRGDTDELCAKLVENAGVLLAPSSLFDAGNERVRIGYGRENLPDALSALEGYLLPT